MDEVGKSMWCVVWVVHVAALRSLYREGSRDGTDDDCQIHSLASPPAHPSIARMKSLTFHCICKTNHNSDGIPSDWATVSVHLATHSSTKLPFQTRTHEKQSYS
jgi:hypothetical protein